MHKHDHSAGGYRYRDSKEEVIALLKYAAEHNESHTEELHNLAHNLEYLHLDDAAKSLHECAADYAKGNEKLQAVLTQLEEGE